MKLVVANLLTVDESNFFNQLTRLEVSEPGPELPYSANVM